MSLVDVLLSNQQVILSLVMVGVVMLFAFGLAVGPSIFTAGKQIMARRKARRAALIARKRKAQRKRAAMAQAKAQALSAAATNPLPPGVRAVYAEQGEIPMLATAEAPAEPAAAAPVAATTEANTTETAATSAAPATTDAAAAEQADEGEEAAETEENSGEFEPATDLQNLLDSVFTNDEQNERYEVLLRGVEVVSAESLLTLARQVAADLRAQNGYQAEGQLS